MRYYIKLTLIILFITSSVMSLKRPNKRVIKKKSEIVFMPVFNRHNMSRCDAGDLGAVSFSCLAWDL